MTAIADAAALVERVTSDWASDVDSDVVWSGDYEGRRGVRVRQQARDFTTVWFDVGQRTLGVEAYVLPSPPSGREEVFRYCLSRNAGARRVHFSLDRHGDLVLTGRVPIGHLDGHEMELLLGEIYQLVELTFRRLVAVGFMREKSP